jgi:gliding motility-associated-like protein
MNYIRTYQILFLVLFSAAFGGSLWAQGTTCGTATAFCSNTLDPFPAGVNQPNAPVGNNYDCLFTQPNPAWFTITMANSGNVDFTLDNTANEDIDFILWGPFTDIAAANAACGNLGNGGASGGVVDCSYSFVSAEQVVIPNAVAGEVYVLMVTNFSNQPTNIFSTANTGTGSFLCDCDLDVNFFETPIPQNEGVLVDTTGNGAEFVLCAPATPSGTPRQLFFTVGISAANATDSLGIHLPSTTLANSFLPGNFNIFGPIYPVIGRFDTMEMTIVVTGAFNEIGIHDFTLGVINFGTTSCIEPLPVRVIIPGVDITAADTALCPAIAHDIPLSAVVFTAASAAGTGDYLWQQVQGAATTINTTTSINPTVSLPSNTVDGDIFRYALTYTDTTGCITSDTLAIRMQTRPLNIALTSDLNRLCNNGQAQTVQLTAALGSTAGIVPTNGTYTWNNTATLSNSTIFNPIATLSGTSAADSLAYIVRFDYGACTGADTLPIYFRDAALVLNPLTDTICAGETALLTARLTDTFVTAGINCNAYTVQPIAFAPQAGIGTRVTDFFSAFGGFPNDDDGISAALPIGFDFSFYCQTYSQFYIGTNGFITFTQPLDNGTGGSPIPAAGGVDNLIALAWGDLDPGAAGTIEYFTVGAAPNRRLIVNFIGVPHFFLPDSTANVQAILYETSNIIELHNTLIQQNDFFSSITQGVENQTGAFGTAVPGRNAAAFTAQNDAFRFTPALTVVTSTPTYAWSPTNSLSSSTIFNPTASPNANTTYNVTVTDVGCAYVGAVPVVVTAALPAPQVSCAIVGSTSITFSWGSLNGANTYEYSIDGNTWVGTTDTFAVISGIAIGTTINLQVRGIAGAGTCIVGAIGTAACTTSGCLLAATVATTNITGCDVENLPANGSAIVSITTGFAPFSYQINGGTAQADSIFANLAVGSYMLTVTETNNTSCTAVLNFTVGNDVGDVRLAAFAQLAGQDTAYIFQAESVLLNAGFNTATTAYAWTGAASISNPSASVATATFDTEGLYTLVVSATVGTCVNTDTVYVVVTPFGFNGMPTAFSPNGDGDNDKFRPAELVGADLAVFRIYNRWGKKVYETTDLSDGGWDGTIGGEPQTRDVYIYYIEFKLGANAETQKIRGEFTLLR